MTLLSLKFLLSVRSGFSPVFTPLFLSVGSNPGTLTREVSGVLERSGEMLDFIGMGRLAVAVVARGDGISEADIEEAWDGATDDRAALAEVKRDKAAAATLARSQLEAVAALPAQWRGRQGGGLQAAWGAPI